MRKVHLGLILAVELLAAFTGWRDAWANKEHVLASFGSGDQSSAHPSQLTLDKSGNLYGTIFFNGSVNDTCRDNGGCGSVIKMSSSGGRVTELYDFNCDGEGDNPCHPAGGVILDPHTGYLYGTAAGSGAVYKGTVFGLSPAGNVTVLHRFESQEGSDPESRLLADASGNLYGTARSGGAFNFYGSVFKLNKSGGDFAVLHSFDGVDGATPGTRLRMDDADNLYGVTSSGDGTIFRMAPDGTETILHFFSGRKDGRSPMDGVSRDKSGNLYGTTYDGGGTEAYCSGGCGVAYKLAADGTFVVLHAFTGRRDGALPMGGLLVSKTGNLYGTTSEGGGSSTCVDGCGTVFGISPDGKFSILHRFAGGPDGATPTVKLVEDSHHNLYGTTDLGGASGQGTVFTVKE